MYEWYFVSTLQSTPLLLYFIPLFMKHSSTLIITGAGISVASGIQPFRGPSGVWEENPMEMATFRKFQTEPLTFLKWYYKRFVSCRHAEPNLAHTILAEKGIRVITQNVDNLHVKAHHPSDALIEIHGNILWKRKWDATSRSELLPAAWDQVNPAREEESLTKIFNLTPSLQEAYRPHILLFDEYYTELYEIEKAMQWVSEANKIIFMGTSNAVGITSMVLEQGLEERKDILVVDPNPAPSFLYHDVEIIKKTAIDFCEYYF